MGDLFEDMEANVFFGIESHFQTSVSSPSNTTASDNMSSPRTSENNEPSPGQQSNQSDRGLRTPNPYEVGPQSNKGFLQDNESFASEILFLDQVSAEVDLNEINVMENLFDSSMDFTGIKSLDFVPVNDAGLPNLPYLGQETPLDKEAVAPQTLGHYQNNTGNITSISYNSENEYFYPTAPQKVSKTPVPCFLQPRVETVTQQGFSATTVPCSQPLLSPNTSQPPDSLLDYLSIKTEPEYGEQTSPVKINYQTKNVEAQQSERDEISPKTLEQLDVDIMETNFINSIEQDPPPEQLQPFSNQVEFDLTRNVTGSVPIFPTCSFVQEILDMTDAVMQPITEIKKEETPIRLCHVCGIEAGSHLHYGGHACASCRAFFRRSLQNNAFERFECSQRNCKIDSKSWRSCKWCRYQKCLQSGMKPELVIGSQPSKPSKRSSEPPEGEEPQLHQDKKAAVSASPSPTTNSANSQSPASEYSNDEILQISAFCDSTRKNYLTYTIRFYAANPSLFKSIASSIFFDQILPFNSFRRLEIAFPPIVEKFILKESDLATLHPEDYSNLITTNYPKAYKFIQSVLMVNTEYFPSSALAIAVKKALIFNPSTGGISSPDDKYLEVLHGLLQDLNVKGHKLPKKALTYFQIFTSPWAETPQMEERHAQIIFDMSSWPMDPTLPPNHVDSIQIVLLIFVLTLSTEYVNVLEPLKVRALQNKYLTMLARYLKYKFKDGAKEHLKRGLKIYDLAAEALSIGTHRLDKE